MIDDDKHERSDDERGGGTGGTATTAPEAGRKPADRDLGHALRSIYSETVKEDVPSELLDLLGKLG